MELLLQKYHLCTTGIWFILLTVFVQAQVAVIAHRKQKRYIPGIIDQDLSHSSFVFRSHRTFLNSLENVPVMLLLIFLGILLEAKPTFLAGLTWTFAIARLMHMFLYYTISTERNPSPRSYFYMIGVLSNAILIAYLGILLIAF